MKLIKNILRLKNNFELSKHERLVTGIVEAIDAGELQVGEKLPSINTMVREIGYARKTIVKAYGELKDRGLIESQKMRGYYLVSEKTDVTLKVALLLFAFKSFQEDFYNTLRNGLGKKYQIDVFFHHNNRSVFENIVSYIDGKYGKYIIAPIQDEAVPHMLKRFSAQKLLLVDRYLNLGHEYSYVVQEFEQATYERLIDLLPMIAKYNRFIYIFDELSHSPTGILRAFQKFVEEKGIMGEYREKLNLDGVTKGDLYFVKNDTTLWYLLRHCANKGYELGKDVGVLSFDDHILKQILLGGVTTLSTDFIEMARIAAQQVKSGEQIQITLPLKLFRRNSL